MMKKVRGVATPMTKLIDFEQSLIPHLIIFEKLCRTSQIPRHGVVLQILLVHQ